MFVLSSRHDGSRCRYGTFESWPCSLLGAEQEADELQTRRDPNLLADLLPASLSWLADELFKWSFYCASFPAVRICWW